MTDQSAISNAGSPIIMPQSQPSVEVERNSKGYRWSIKMIGNDLVELKKKTDELNKLYPNEK